MANPPVTLIDSDALIELFLADELTPLKTLTKGYHIQPTITEEVNTELRWLRKHKDRFVPQLDKSLKSGVITVLNQEAFNKLLPHAPAGASWPAYQALGRQYHVHVGGRGEAFTHAAGVTLGMPAVSNDFSAMATLSDRGLAMPIPVLRVFDLLVFCYQTGSMSSEECDEFRKKLLAAGEGLPKAFQHAKFIDGLLKFAVRLKEGTSPNPAPAAPDFQSTMWISR